MPTAASISAVRRAALGFRHAQQIEGQGDVLLDAEIGQDVKGLKDESHRAAPQQSDRVIVQCRQIDAIEQHCGPSPARSRPASKLSRVDLPTPDSPMTARYSPCRSSRSSRSKIAGRSGE